MISDLERRLINRAYTPVAWYVVRRCFQCRPNDLWNDPDRLYVITSDGQLAGCGICETHLRQLRDQQPWTEVVETWMYPNGTRHPVRWMEKPWWGEDRIHALIMAMPLSSKPIIRGIV